MEKLPCMVHDNEQDKDATGIYLNYLLLDDLILMPSYTKHQKANEVAHKILEKHYNRKVIDIIADDIAKHGGVINCVTWTK
jgi:agmatine deiminase